MTTVHKMHKQLFLVLIYGIFCISCFREGAVGEGAIYRLEVSETSISVPADAPDQPVVEKTLSITCNRSWSAYCEPAVDWLTLSVEEMENIARIQEKTDVTLIFDNNEDRTATRETELVVSTAESSVRIPVRQGKQVPYIQLLTPATVDDLSCMEEVSVVRFASNIEWVASIEEGATAQVVMDKTGGKYDGEITLTFSENDNTELMPEAVLVLNDPQGGLEAPVKVYFKQGKALPYIQWKSGDQVFRGSLATSLILDFKTNSSWSAALEAPVDGVSLPVTSGDKTVSQLTVNLDDFIGIGKERSAKVVLSLATGESAALNIRQVATGFVLDFSLGNQPFTTDIPHSTISGLTGVLVKDEARTYTYVCEGVNYEFVIYSGSGFALIDNTDPAKSDGLAWVQSSRNVGQGSWVKLPAVEGMKLKTVRVFMSNLSAGGPKIFKIADEQPLSYSDPTGAHTQANVSVTKGTWGQLDLKSPEVDRIYYMVAGNGSTNFNKLYLEYASGTE